MTSQQNFRALGHKVEPARWDLETFPTPSGLTSVTLECTEVTSMCPVTGAPDFETVIIEYVPNLLCLESKSLKLALATLRDKGVFCEALAVQIANDLFELLSPEYVSVTVKQVPRGGISIVGRALRMRDVPFSRTRETK